MSQAEHREVLTFEGRDFEVLLYHDDNNDAPWERDCGVGTVTEVLNRYDRHVQKDPGQRVLHSTRHNVWLYDFAGTMKRAKIEGWGLADEDKEALAKKLKRQPTAGEVRLEAVQRDFDRLRRWLNDDWWYVGVCVRMIGADGEPVGDEFDHALWGVESDGDYWKEVARDLADEIMGERRAEWRAALREARERRYWASRDITTEAA